MNVQESFPLLSKTHKTFRICLQLRCSRLMGWRFKSLARDSWRKKAHCLVCVAFDAGLHLPASWAWEQSFAHPPPCFLGSAARAKIQAPVCTCRNESAQICCFNQFFASFSICVSCTNSLHCDLCLVRKTLSVTMNIQICVKVCDPLKASTSFAYAGPPRSLSTALGGSRGLSLPVSCPKVHKIVFCAVLCALFEHYLMCEMHSAKPHSYVHVFMKAISVSFACTPFSLRPILAFHLSSFLSLFPLPFC